MLVSTMTEKEAISEVKSDFIQYAYGRIESVCEMYAKRRKQNNTPKDKVYPLVYKKRSPKKNNWLFIVNKALDKRKFKDKYSTSIAFITYYFNQQSFRVFKIIPNEFGAGIKGIGIYNAHLFRRYAERMNLDFTDPSKTVQDFFKNNTSIFSKQTKENQIFGVCTDGIVLGTIKKNSVIEYKTFISRNLLFENQNEQEKEMIKSLYNELNESLNTSTFSESDRLKYDYTLATLKSIVKN